MRAGHFTCERGCTRDDHGEAGPFSVERLKRDLPFVACANKCTARCRPSWSVVAFVADELSFSLAVPTRRAARHCAHVST